MADKKDDNPVEGKKSITSPSLSYYLNFLLSQTEPSNDDVVEECNEAICSGKPIQRQILNLT